MKTNRYLPPTRPLEKRNRYAPAPRGPTLPVEVVPPTRETVDLTEFVQGILGVRRRERDTYLATWAERFRLHRNRKLASSWNLLTAELTAVLDNATTLERKRTALEHLHLEDKLRRLTLEADIAEQQRRKRRAEEDD